MQEPLWLIFGTTGLVSTLPTMCKVTSAVLAKHSVRMVLRKVALALADVLS